VKAREGGPQAPMPAELPFPESLCHRCDGARYVTTKTSRFVRCVLLPTKYPRQPIGQCPGFRPKDRA